MRKLILLVVVLLCTGVADAQQYWKIDEEAIALHGR